MTSLLRLEGAGVLRARWLVGGVLVALLLVGLFGAVSTQESAVVAFTGFSRVITGVGLASLLLVPLMSLFATAQAVTGARTSGALEWYVSHPVSRDACFTALFAPRLAAATGPVLVAVAALGALGLASGQGVAPDLLARVLALLLGQAFCFGAVGMALSVRAATAERALLESLVVWLTAVALLDFAMIGAMLQWNLPPHLVFLLSGANPVQAGRLALLAGTDAGLGVLGPVGTYVSLTLGPVGTLAYGLLWPLIVGSLALVWARRTFARGDLL